MRPSFFLLPTVLVVALAVACQPAADPALNGEAAAAGPSDAPAAVVAPAAEGRASDAFRATGNEPGWLAEVAAGGGSALRVEVDYGQTQYEVAAPTHGPDGWAGAAADGTPIKLSVQRVPCQDDMSGKTFDAKVMLTVGTRQLHGCGSFSAAQ